MLGACSSLSLTPCAGLPDCSSTEALTIKCTDEAIYVGDTKTHTNLFSVKCYQIKKMRGMYFFGQLIPQVTFHGGFWRVHETYISLEMQLIYLFFKEELICQGKKRLLQYFWSIH